MYIIYIYRHQVVYTWYIQKHKIIKNRYFGEMSSIVLTSNQIISKILCASGSCLSIGNYFQYWPGPIHYPLHNLFSIHIPTLYGNKLIELSVLSQSQNDRITITMQIKNCRNIFVKVRHCSNSFKTSNANLFACFFKPCTEETHGDVCKL